MEEKWCSPRSCLNDSLTAGHATHIPIVCGAEGANAQSKLGGREEQTGVHHNVAPAIGSGMSQGARAIRSFDKAPVPVIISFWFTVVGTIRSMPNMMQAVARALEDSCPGE